MTKFQTRELEYYYNIILARFPIMRIIPYRIMLRNKLKNLVLPDKPISEYETFVQELNVIGCGIVTVTWNIEKLLTYQPNDNDFQYHTTGELLTLIDMAAPQTYEVLSEIEFGLKSQHRKEYIILAMLPGFQQFGIIDGNHRVLEKINEIDYTFKCFMLADKRVLDFLEPNSRKFIETIYWINDILQKRNQL